MTTIPEGTSVHIPRVVLDDGVERRELTGRVEAGFTNIVKADGALIPTVRLHLGNVDGQAVTLIVHDAGWLFDLRSATLVAEARHAVAFEGDQP